jgi:hypothetical protein
VVPALPREKVRTYLNKKEEKGKWKERKKERKGKKKQKPTTKMVGATAQVAELTSKHRALEPL